MLVLNYYLKRKEEIYMVRFCTYRKVVRTYRCQNTVHLYVRVQKYTSLLMMPREHCCCVRYSCMASWSAPSCRSSCGCQAALSKTMDSATLPSRPALPDSCEKSVIRFGAPTWITHRTCGWSKPGPNADVATTAGGSVALSHCSITALFSSSVPESAVYDGHPSRSASSATSSFV
jgi:hypothetical protein